MALYHGSQVLPWILLVSATQIIPENSDLCVHLVDLAFLAPF